MNFVEGWVYIIISKHFDGRLEAFSINKQLHSVFFVIFQIFVLASADSIDLKWIFAFGILLIIPSAFMLQGFPDGKIDETKREGYSHFVDEGEGKQG